MGNTINAARSVKMPKTEQQIKALDELELLLTPEKKAMIKEFIETELLDLCKIKDIKDYVVPACGEIGSDFNYIGITTNKIVHRIYNTKHPAGGYLKKLLLELSRKEQYAFFGAIMSYDGDIAKTDIDGALKYLEEAAKTKIAKKRLILKDGGIVKHTFKKTKTKVVDFIDKFKNKGVTKSAVAATEEVMTAVDVTESQAVKQVEKEALTSAEKTAGKTAGKIIGKKLLGLLGIAANFWAIYDTLSGKDFPVHSGGMHKAKEELTVASYSEKEYNDALELYMRLNKPTTKTLAGVESYPAFFVYIKFAKDKRIQNMPPRKIKAMINLTIDCINKKYFTTSGFTVDETIKAFDNFEKMNRLFKK